MDNYCPMLAKLAPVNGWTDWFGWDSGTYFRSSGHHHLLLLHTWKSITLAILHLSVQDIEFFISFKYFLKMTPYFTVSCHRWPVSRRKIPSFTIINYTFRGLSVLWECFTWFYFHLKHWAFQLIGKIHLFVLFLFH